MSSSGTLGRPAVSVRLGTEADVEAMQRVRMSVRENRLSDPSRVQPHHTLEMLREHGRGWVAEADGEVVGFAVGDRTRSNVWALFVDPAYEGRGLGRQLHDAMLDWFFAGATETVWLSTDPGTRAETFYRSAGWMPVGALPNGELRFEMPRQRWLRR